MKKPFRARRPAASLVSTFVGITICASLACGNTPAICGGDTATAAPAAPAARAPRAVQAYIDSLGGNPFDQRAACARWASTFSLRLDRYSTRLAAAVEPEPARFILFPAAGHSLQDLANWLSRAGQVAHVEQAANFLVVTFTRDGSTSRMREVLQSPRIAFAEPDCDGPDFATTSFEIATAFNGDLSCWQRAARTTFPNDPCIDELWGHSKIGWDSAVAARSLPRLVALLDSGVDATHADLARNVLVRARSYEPARSQGRRLNALCATSGRCYPHGTQMAGTIAGRMDNGIGIAGVAPNSRLLPIVISQVDDGHLARLSTIAEAINAAVRGHADIINVSAKWPVDSRAVSEAIRAAVTGREAGRRLLVTGYATSLDLDESVREYYPSQYRCLAGVLAAVPADMRGHELFNPGGRPNAGDGRIQAPGVDIVVTTTENSERGYALSGAAGASSAAAYVSGAVALIWGSPPLNKCDAQQIKELLFCRSKSSDSTRYPWIHVDFLRELADVDPGADCRAAMEQLGCG